MCFLVAGQISDAFRQCPLLPSVEMSCELAASDTPAAAMALPSACRSFSAAP